ncbi:hypothetical protein [Agrococcus sp. SCSIO52902]|uniref:hypothetical protein n=1 Tax=Agrococcus sp. SCSIO52902 TaxID=2933290 RepID=UPI001FF1F239|nr:hypothetical protein [Agrococcus sp. SCSIO52902]UOV99941.1 hypothetical protein MU522_08260 [Agrococcus sp. SCSIO52902]
MDHLDSRLRDADPWRALRERTRDDGSVRAAASALVRDARASADAPAARRRGSRRIAIAAAAAALIAAPAGIAWAAGGLQGALGEWLGVGPLTSPTVRSAPTTGEGCVVGAWLAPRPEGDDGATLEFTWTPDLIALTGTSGDISPPQHLSIVWLGEDQRAPFDQRAFDRVATWASAQDWDTEVDALVEAGTPTDELAIALGDRFVEAGTAAGVLPEESAALVTSTVCGTDG